MGISWKGSISFGLIYIPITLQIATQEVSISFNQLHNKCKQRIKYKKVCPYCNSEVESKDIIKGYEYEKDKYVLFEDSDFDKLKTEKNKSIVIEQFTDLDEVDRIYYDKSYYVIPSGAEKAFQLLKKAMIEEKKIGIAKVVLGEKENLIALRVNEKDMILSTLFFANEVRKSSASNVEVALNDKELKLAKAIINNMAEPFEPSKYHDEYQERLLSAIEMKIKGKEITVKEDKTINKAVDLMDALQASLLASKGNKANAVH